jgi:hypothetical protein
MSFTRLLKKELFQILMAFITGFLKKNYFADFPASYSTRTGAIVFVPIDRRTRRASLRQ